ncbi:MAG: MarR family transcriptional regulator [Hamadaea sp.]|nr:MarR family transcriptional regulator [Hamadaea sp.]
MKTEARWLSDEEQRSWRAFLDGTRLLMLNLERGHQRHGLSSTDYEILVQLSESPEHRMRMSQLAVATLLEKSRLSHQITRMEKAGLIERQPCPDDRRGQFAVLTEHGWQTIQRVAVDHVNQVRDIFVDRMTPEQFAVLGAAFEQVAAGLRKPQPAECAEALGYDEAEAACDGD